MSDKKTGKVETQTPKEGYLIDDESKNVHPAPKIVSDDYKPADKLHDKVAIVTGGDSGIGASTALYFAKEGADIVFTYYDEEEDAARMVDLIEAEGRQVVSIKGDVGEESFAEEVVKTTVAKFGKIDILVNVAGEQHVQEHLTDITAAQLDRTFRTNIFSNFYFIKAALPHLTTGASIINTASITAYQGSPALLDYSSTKGAIVSFTRSLSQNQDLLDRKIRVNAVAPGPIWTPLIPATFTEEQLENWGDTVPLGRSGEAYELAPAYVYLASSDSSYVSGQTIHVNGGTVING
ncbi:SDR family oxidoreductase [Listeria grayi]|uniref:Oxidoreductase, short chain dehydrogenase/reductase family protein n=2 Tax=Listeria grayi TaxID=1641 RepID=D7UXC5_LISGR|nr:SDR family oxidoreductase [Listeria grayi]EFI84333.1 oxidoreductase, short chain dehydrogenase/reductase family protein [Listeria grayi DSM 20601]STY45388.1 General stress protein 39 [Listeria grayi]